MFQHHNYCDNLKVLNTEEEKILKLLEKFDSFKISKRNLLEINNKINDKTAIIVKGFLHKCDYSASSHTIIEIENNFLNQSLNQINYKWNELQHFMIENKNENVIAIAQTGMGKTEAGLLWIDNNKGFFILPLKSAINSIYERIKNNILKNNDIENKLSLLHSDTFNEYITHKYNEFEINEYYKKTKQLSIPLTISTLDQLFDFVFKYSGYELKIATLSYSKVIIDEIQMYSPDLLAYLIYGIKFLIEFGCKISILTATLSPFVLDLFEKNNIKFKYKEFINDDLKRHNVKIINEKINSDFIKSIYADEIYKDSNKILVICNTVKKAQQLYDELKDFENVNLLHSKFIKQHRKIKEENILSFGKTEFKSKGIWISTQIVEASLDIDFDILITELSDLNGLFQRLGRCNRKGLKNIDNANCFVFSQIDKNNFYFIDEDIFKLSQKSILNINGILTESEKLKIIKKTLTTENIKNTNYYRIFKDKFNKISNLSSYEVNKEDILKEFRNIVSFDVIPENIYKENESFILKNIEILNSDVTKIQKETAKYEILNLTLSINSIQKDQIIKESEITKFHKISIIKCFYDDKTGFVKTKTNSNDIDEFQ